jgi:hypothetical protein
MARRFRPSLERIEVRLLDDRPASWDLFHEPVTGNERVYRVFDHNYERNNEWEFTIRIPKDSGREIEVRPKRVPNLAAWSGLERRSLIFPVATEGRHRRKRYCKVPLPSPGKSDRKRFARFSERADLPPWFGPLARRMKQLKSVRASAGTDHTFLTILLDPDDYELCIRLFFATWVLPLKEKVTLDAAE